MFHLNKDGPVYTAAVKEYLQRRQTPSTYTIIVPLQCRLVHIYIEDGVSILLCNYNDFCYDNVAQCTICIAVVILLSSYI